MAPSILREIEGEVSTAGGRIEWVTAAGVGVSFRNSKLDDAKLRKIPKTIRHAVWLDLANTMVTDVGCETLGDAASLESIDLSGTHVTRHCLESLKKLRTLAEVKATETGISERDVYEVSKVSTHFSVSL